VLSIIYFFGALRPGEAFKLRRADIILPEDLGSTAAERGVVYIVIQNPGKARRRGERSQHVLIDDAAAVAFLTWAVQGLPRHAVLWTLKPAAFRRHFDTYLGTKLGLPVRAAVNGFTPASLRAGCASELYLQSGRDLDHVQWHLRHGDASTLRSYIQELPLALARASLPTVQAARVRRIAPLAGALMLRARFGLEGPRLKYSA